MGFYNCVVKRFDGSGHILQSHTKLNPHQSWDALTEGRDSFILLHGWRKWDPFLSGAVPGGEWTCWKLVGIVYFISCGALVVTTYLLLWVLVVFCGSGGNRHPESHFIFFLWWWWCEDCYLLPINAVAQLLLLLLLPDWAKLMSFLLDFTNDALV